MKNLKFYLLCLLSASVLALSCGRGDDDPDGNGDLTPEEQRAQELAEFGPWSIEGGTVTRDGIDRTDDFSGFVLTFQNNRNFTTQNSPSDDVWPSSGNYEFGANNNTLNRNDGVQMTITTFSEDSLVITFEVTEESAAARTLGFAGQYTFTLTSAN